MTILVQAFHPSRRQPSPPYPDSRCAVLYNVHPPTPWLTHYHNRPALTYHTPNEASGGAANAQRDIVPTSRKGHTVQQLIEDTLCGGPQVESSITQ
jgi:hypothetical protein